MEQDPELRWIDAGVLEVRVDVCQVQSTREETRLLLGALQGGDPPTARLLRQIVLNPTLAKQLGASLARVLQAHEAQLANATPAGNLHSTPGDEDAPAAARPLLARVRELGVGFGFERSFKMSAAGLQGERLILGVRSKHADATALAGICRGIGMPDAQVARFEQALPEANTVGFGFEGDERGGVYKVYLEFWEQLWRRLRRAPSDLSPALLFLGFKWPAGDSARATVARYTCHPLLPVEGIRRRLEALYEGRTDSASLQASRDILALAAQQVRGDSFVYVEAQEDGNPRRSFDLNLYKARLGVRALQPALTALARRYGIAAPALAALDAQAGDRQFGHLSGGLGRDGQDFLTVYYELEAL